MIRTFRRLPALTAVPVAALSATLLIPPTAVAQSTGSSGSLNTGSLPGSSAHESGPCNNFFGNFPPNSLGLDLTTGSLANAANSVAGLTTGSMRQFPRWITGAEGTIPVLKGATTVRQLVTGPTSPSETDSRYNIHGTDLGIMFEHSDETMVVFGDTFGECTPTGNSWRSNVLLTAESGTPTDGLDITGARPLAGNEADALVQGLHQPNGTGEVTKIPTAAISVGEDMYMRIMSVHDWNAPGGWTTNYSALVKSTDGGNTWKIVPGSLRRMNDFQTWGPGIEFTDPDAELPAPDPTRWRGMQMSAFLEADGYLYEYMTPSGRSGPATVARVPLTEIEDPTAYTWLASNGTWSDEPTGHVVLDGRVEELSVAYNEHLDQYVLLTSMATGVVSMRVAGSPEGPWSSPQTLVDRKMFPNAYAPMIHPSSITSEGPYLYYTLSTWDAYNVFLLRTDLSQFNFTAPDTNPKTDVTARVTVSDAVESGAIDDSGRIDAQRLAEAAEQSPAAPEPETKPVG